MTSLEDDHDSPTLPLDGMGSVLVCQDEDGNLVLSCNDNSLGVDDNVESAQKELCLLSEDDPALTTSSEATGSNKDYGVTVVIGQESSSSSLQEAPCSDDSPGTIAQLEVPLDPVSPQQSQVEADPVNQTWFTTKGDKNSLQNKGHKWKQGMWSKEETEILKANIDNFLKSNNIRDATEVIFETPKDERKDFYRSIARGLNRPLFAVYRRVLRLYDNRNHVGKYSSLEIKQLKELRMKHGNDWAAIGAALGRSASSVKDRCRLMKDTCNTGKWAVEEERRLASVVHEMTGTPPGTTVTQGVCWAEVAEQVRTRSEKQCRSKWLNYLNWKQSGGREWNKDDDVNLILRIAELQPSEESQISWEKLAAGWSSVRSPQWLHSKWWSLKRQVTNHQQLAFPDLLEFLESSHVPVLRQAARRAAAVAPGGPVTTPFSSSEPAHVAPSALRLKGCRLEGSPALPQTSLATLQIPVHITQAGDSTDGETLTINGSTLQAFEIVPSFHLQPMATLGTLLLQTSSSQSLPLTLAPGSSSALSTGPSAGSQQILVHTIPSDTVMHEHPEVEMPISQSSIIIHTLPSHASTVTTTGPTRHLSIDPQPHGQPTDAHVKQSIAPGIKADVVASGDPGLERDNLDTNGLETVGLEPSEMDLGPNGEVQHELGPGTSDLGADGNDTADIIDDAAHYVAEALCSPGDSESSRAMEESEDSGIMAVIVSSQRFASGSDELDDVSVLPLTTLNDPILQSHAPHLMGSTLNSPEANEGKDSDDA
uniref:cyclin-D-binding Myb-like transcription factor 1 isoform X1 n=2 Tax=Myxine glutinosa TaxID=7769 RepID=UPI00358FDB70